MLYMLYIFLSSTLALAYIGIIRFYRYHWNSLDEFHPPKEMNPSITVSVVVAARNEAENLPDLLQSFQQLQYPTHLFEIIIVDDHSEDNTAKLINAYPLPHLKLLSLQGSTYGKKAAIAKAITEATGELIVTTDADCRVPNDWLHTLTAYYTTYNAKFIAAPVIFEPTQNILEHFQALDFLGMMLITGAGIKSRFMHMSNGANLAYPKAVFEALEGFKGIDQIASGDDILFMQKVAQKYPGQIGFVKHASTAVKTPPMRSLGEFIGQRIRWGTKSAQYDDWQITAVLALVFFFCWNILLSLVLSIWLGWVGILLLLIQLGIKVLVDYFFLRQASTFFGKSALMKYFFPAQILHILYIAAIGFVSAIFKQYAWKGRKVS